jgi:hypothetical protein
MLRKICYDLPRPLGRGLKRSQGSGLNQKKQNIVGLSPVFVVSSSTT